MKATELRLNNLYFDSRAKRTLIVRGIDEGFIDHKDSDNMPTRWEFAEGIPLTEEWLIRLGFEVEETTTYSPGYEKPYKVYRKGLFTYNGIQSAWWYNGQVMQRQPEFVHQLMNVFYALTGQELTLSPPQR